MELYAGFSERLTPTDPKTQSYFTEHTKAPNRKLVIFVKTEPRRVKGKMVTCECTPHTSLRTTIAKDFESLC